MVRKTFFIVVVSLLSLQTLANTLLSLNQMVNSEQYMQCSSRPGGHANEGGLNNDGSDVAYTFAFSNGHIFPDNKGKYTLFKETQHHGIITNQEEIPLFNCVLPDKKTLVSCSYKENPRHRIIAETGVYESTYYLNHQPVVTTNPTIEIKEINIDTLVFKEIFYLRGNVGENIRAPGGNCCFDIDCRGLKR